MANSASSTITVKMDLTTEEVVRSPTDSALPDTRMPSRQPIMAIAIARNGALMMPTKNVLVSIAASTRCR